MRFLLVRPPISLEVARRLQPFLHLEPLALEIVAGGIPAPHEPRILDLASMQPAAAAARFRQILGDFQPDVVGLTGYSNEAHTVKDLARLAKQVLPATFVMVGGPHATVVPGDLRLPGVIDLVVRGEGGSVMPRLSAGLDAGAGVPSHPALLSTGSPRFAELAALPPPELPAFEAVPKPRRDLVDRTRYYCIWHGEPRERLNSLFPQTAALRTSVGCPHRCSFCVVHYLARGKYVQGDPEAVVADIAAVPEDHIYFVDDEMFVNARRTEAIAQLLLQRGIRKKYVSWARADTVCRSPELFRLWKQVGLSLLYVGLESMEAEQLEGYHKGVDPETNRRAVRILRELGIGLHAALMVRPDFTDADFLALRRAVAAVTPAEVSFTVFSPPPGTPLWEQHRQQFICPDPYAFYDCMHTLLPTRLPLKRFYSHFALLWLFAVRNNPWRRNRVRVPLRDFCRFMVRGAQYGWALRRIYRDYQAFGRE
jgi:radical SAM superfamily enzyme YgiQ (UPF0313 family)